MDQKKDAPLPRSQYGQPEGETPRADPGMQTKDTRRDGMPRESDRAGHEGTGGTPQGFDDREQSNRNAAAHWPSGEDDAHGSVPDFDRKAGER